MRFVSATGPALLLFASAGFLLHSCVRPAGAPLPTQSHWPPTSAACVRHEPVDAYAIGEELTRLHADRFCVGQYNNCSWTNPQTRELPDSDPGGGTIWMDLASHTFSIAEQNDIVARVRATAASLRPPGTIFYRLTFEDSVITSTSGNPPVRVITATAYYAHCRSNPGPYK